MASRFFNEILQGVQRGLRGEIEEQFAPTSPEGFEYNPTYQGTRYPADQPVEPRTIQSTPDYYGNTIPIDAFKNGVNPDRGVRSFTNIPGRGPEYELIEEATPAGTKSVYDTIGPVDIPEDATPEEQARIRWETNKQYEEARDVQDIHARGLENEVQADLLRQATGKLSFKEQISLQEQKDIGAVGVERTKGLISMAEAIQSRLFEVPPGEEFNAERKALQKQYDDILDLISGKKRQKKVAPKLGPPPGETKKVKKARIAAERSARAFTGDESFRRFTELSPRQLAGTGRLNLPSGLFNELSNEERLYGPIGLFR